MTLCKTQRRSLVTPVIYKGRSILSETVILSGTMAGKLSGQSSCSMLLHPLDFEPLTPCSPPAVRFFPVEQSFGLTCTRREGSADNHFKHLGTIDHVELQ